MSGTKPRRGGTLYWEVAIAVLDRDIPHILSVEGTVESALWHCRVRGGVGSNTYIYHDRKRLIALMGIDVAALA